MLGNTANKVYLPGGQVRSNEMSVYGSMAVEQLNNYWLDHVFIGVSGVTEAGCFDYSLEDTEVKRVYIDRARQVVVLCDSSKFEHLSVIKVCELAAVNVLVTEAPPPKPLAKVLDRAGVQVLVAAPQ
jgi:DeoR/GlpR family transcriptional regulator of sugar metabolism